MSPKRKTSFIRSLIERILPHRTTSNTEDDSGDVDTGETNAETELATELKLAFDSYSKGVDLIPCREIGYILRSLGQNPTENEIIALVCEAGCDWEGYLTREDFLSVAYVSMQKQANRYDDIKAAFRAFDHNGDGSISQEELKEAMLRFGHTFTEEECDEMFRLSDLNCDGKIDWEEFLQMMLPGHKEINYAKLHDKN